jgi:imidazolonepropionase-like amidohydrolase
MRAFTTALAALLSTIVAGCRPAMPATAGTAPVPGNSFIVRNVRVFDGERVIERAHVVVRDGRIASVGRSSSSGLPVVPGEGRTLLPGLIDAHAHVPNVGALRNALRFGVTTTVDMMTRPEFARSQRPRRDSVVRTDLADLYSIGVPVTSPRGMGTQFGIPLTTIASAAEAPEIVRERLADGSDLVKIMHEPDAGIVSSISFETLAAVVAAAQTQGALAVAHVSSLRGAREVVAARADGLAHLFSDTLIDAALVKQIADQRIFVVPTLSNFAAFEGGPQRRELAADPRLAPYLTAAQQKALTGPPPGKDSPMASYLARFTLATATENVRRLHAAGVRILAGDDAASDLVAIGPGMHGELELLVKAGLTPREALEAATSGPARAFRLGDRGRIVAGARADLVLVDGNPLADITATRAISRVFKNGYDVVRAVPSAVPQPGER